MAQTVVCGVAVAAMMLLPRPAMAQTPGGLSFGATLESIKINAKPGQVVTRQFRLTLDPNQRATRFSARVEDWWRSEDGQQSFYSPAGTLRRSCGSWVAVNPVESTVEPGATLVVRLSVAIPTEVQPGGFWCALTVDELADPIQAAQDSVGVRFQASVSTGIFVYIDPVERSAVISDVATDADAARVRVRNDGNSPVGIDGRVEFLAPGASEPTAVLNLPRITLLTEPSREGVLTAPLPALSALPSGTYRMRVILDFGADHYIGAEREVRLARPVASREPMP